MSLDWDISEVENNDEIKADGSPWVTTETLIWYTMAVDMGEITKENYDEFFKRVSIWETINGAGKRKYNPDTDEHEDIFMTLEDVERRIGLSTNVITRDREEWGERIAEVLFDRADRKVRDLRVSRKVRKQQEEAAA
jgi:hypothetical protein